MVYDGWCLIVGEGGILRVTLAGLTGNLGVLYTFSFYFSNHRLLPNRFTYTRMLLDFIIIYDFFGYTSLNKQYYLKKKEEKFNQILFEFC